MSVVIRGMKMPKDCTECRFAYDGMCLANWGRKSKIDVTNYCPLIELPTQHGRLIDADALMENAQYKGTHDIVTAWDIVAAPTIIEAEEVSE